MFHSPMKKQGGSMIVIAIFVIVVMAGMALTLTRLLSASAESVVTEVYGFRAFNAASSGLQVIIADAFPLNAAAACTPSTPRSINSNTLGGFSATQGLVGCNFVASCSAQALTINGQARTYYEFSSQAECEISSSNVVSRSVRVDALQ